MSSNPRRIAWDVLQRVNVDDAYSHLALSAALDRSTLTPVDKGLATVDAMLAEVKTGDGLVHAMIYGDNGEDAITEAKLALAEAKQLIADVRTKKGVVHNLIYDEDRGEFITNLNEASADVKATIELYDKFNEWTPPPKTELSEDYDESQDFPDFHRIS